MNSRLDRGECEAMVEVNVGDEWNRCLADDIGKRLRSPLIGDCNAYDLRAGVRQARNLLDGGLCIGRVRVRHRLNDNGSVAADLNVAHMNGTRFSARS